jgi:hypothetical protein
MIAKMAFQDDLPADMTCSAVHEGGSKVIVLKFHDWHIDV